MKRLILVRHGKSSWEHDLEDRERPLTKRGLSDGPMVAEAFKKEYALPEMIWTSDAVRANTTADIFKDVLNISDSNFEVKPKLYTFDEKKLKHHIRGCEESINTLMVFGHNDAMTSLVNNFGDKYVGNVPTTGLTIIDFDVERWTQVKKGTTVTTIFPKDLK